ncbi:MAG: T9SS type A sorting domain-containing protein [Bacteroidetes bacterium]|nr:T9SS type A sorting domain-containing protein [Bacteroidota bacterium]
MNHEPKHNIHVQLIDMTGKTIFKTDYISSYEIVLSMGNYAKGMYLLEVIVDGKQYREKLNKL